MSISKTTFTISTHDSIINQFSISIHISFKIPFNILQSNPNTFSKYISPDVSIKSLNILKRREECDTYLTHVCRFRLSLFLQLMKATVLAESSFIFSPRSIRYADVYRRESGRCRTLPFF